MLNQKFGIRGLSFLLAFFVMGSLSMCKKESGSTKKSETITIAVQSHAALAAAAQFLGAFEEETGIKVVMDESPQAQLSEKILLDLSGGTGAFDSVGIHYTWMAGWAEPGWIKPIDEYIAKEDPAQFDYADFIMPELFNYKGKQYGIPFYTETLMLFYNREIFAAAGLPDRGPKDWDELLEFCKMIKAKTDKVPIAMRGIADNRSILYTYNIFAFSNGWKGWFDENNVPRANFFVPEMVEASKFYCDLLNQYGPEGVAGYNWPDVQTLLQQGIAAMGMDADNFAGRLEDPSQSTVSGKMGYDLVPAAPTGLRKPGITSYGLYIPAASKHQDAAWKFINWITGKDMQLKESLAGARGDVTRRSVFQNSQFQQKYNFFNYQKARAESFDISIRHNPLLTYYSEIAQEYAVALNRILIGSDPSAQLRDLDGRVNAIIAKNK